MVDSEKLNRYIRNSGIKKGKLAEMLDISQACFSGKIYNHRPFSESEIDKLVHALCISAEDTALVFLPETSKITGHSKIQKLTDADTSGIGPRIRSARRAKKITQQELATALGIRGTTLAKYERGSIDGIPPKKVISICHALDVSPNYLFGWDEPSNT